MVMTRLLEIDGLYSGYGTASVLQDVSIHLDSGEAIAVLGANGAGKSTLLRTISGLVPVHAGVIDFDGTSLTSRRPEQIARLGIAHVLEARGILPSLTVRENILLGSFATSGTVSEHEVIEEALGWFPKLKPKLSQYAGILSGGEQQMVALARAMTSKPRLLLLDEPSQGLAPSLVDEIFSVLAKLVEQRQAVILVEQFTSQARYLCERAYVFQRGRIAAHGAIQELTESGELERVYLS